MNRMQNNLEHLNITVSAPAKTSALLCLIFNWQQRWQGPALDKGTTIHVGSEDTFLALYAHNDSNTCCNNNHKTVRNLNHIGIVVDDLDLIEQRVKAQGLSPFNHRDYHPQPGGKRFYFLLDDDIEIEVISYR